MWGVNMGVIKSIRIIEVNYAIGNCAYCEAYYACSGTNTCRYHIEQSEKY